MLTDAQIANRMKGLGASEVSALFGLNEYTTPYQIWLEKTGRYKPDWSGKNDRLWYGSHLEEVIAKRYMFETGEVVTADPETRYRAEYPYLLCHIDREIKEKRKLVEIKIARYNPAHWGEPGSSEILPQYQIQVQAQLACNPGYEEADLCVFFYQTLEIKIYTIKRNEELIKRIGSASTRFWEMYVLADTPPQCESIDDVKLAHPINNDEFLEATPLELDAYERIKEVRERIKELEKEELKHKTDLIVLCGANAGIKSDNKILCTYKVNKNGSRTFNLK